MHSSSPYKGINTFESANIGLQIDDAARRDSARALCS